MTDQVTVQNKSLSASNRRKADRIRVLLGGVVVTPDGEQAKDCIIRDISARGANIRCSMSLDPGDEIFLLDSRNRSAYFATIAWRKSQSYGLSFIRTYQLNLGTPLEKDFLEQHLVNAKLRQIAAIEKKGIPLDEAASLVGLTEQELAKAAVHSSSEIEALIDRLVPCVSSNGKSALGATFSVQRRIPNFLKLGIFKRH